MKLVKEFIRNQNFAKRFVLVGKGNEHCRQDIETIPPPP